MTKENWREHVQQIVALLMARDNHIQTIKAVNQIQVLTEAALPWFIREVDDDRLVRLKVLLDSEMIRRNTLKTFL